MRGVMEWGSLALEFVLIVAVVCLSYGQRWRSRWNDSRVLWALFAGWLVVFTVQAALGRGLWPLWLLLAYPPMLFVINRVGRPRGRHAYPPKRKEHTV